MRHGVNTDISFPALLARCREGEEDANRILFEKVAHRLIGLARQHLRGQVRRKVDPEDVVQSVFKSFFGDLRDGDFDLKTWDNLWSLLVVITLRKCGRKVKHFLGPWRDVRREATNAPSADESMASCIALAHDPTPAEAVVLSEIVEQTLRPLKERERKVFEMHLQGHAIEEICAQVQRSEYTVRDVLKRIEKGLEKQCEEILSG
jgi:RNA polymerase sigma factor (sigma-70 family)